MGSQVHCTAVQGPATESARTCMRLPLNGTSKSRHSWRSSKPSGSSCPSSTWAHWRSLAPATSSQCGLGLQDVGFRVWGLGRGTPCELQAMSSPSPAALCREMLAPCMPCSSCPRHVHDWGTLGQSTRRPAGRTDWCPKALAAASASTKPVRLSLRQARSCARDGPLATQSIDLRQGHSPPGCSVLSAPARSS